jgi:uncharacterized spore protein YtfJ
MEVQEILSNARSTLTTRTVFADPYEKNGLTVIAAAKVAGGGGGGSGQDDSGQSGDGGGFGMMARPAGAYVIDGDKVRWQPAVDANRVIAAVATIVVTALITRAITTPWRTMGKSRGRKTKRAES